jgi:hypothetical protein
LTELASQTEELRLSAFLRSRLGKRLALSLTAIIAIAIVGWWALQQEPTGDDGPIVSSIAVLPLENLSGDPEQDYFVDWMTEALVQMERALELDPLNPLFRALYGVVLCCGIRQCDDAIEQFRGVLKTVPNHPLALWQVIESFYAKGMYEQAFKAAKSYSTLIGGRGEVEALEQGCGG